MPGTRFDAMCGRETMWHRIAIALAALLALGAVAGCGRDAAAPPLVLAAASLQESMTAAADAWAAEGHARPTVSFAATSALARQIEAGAPADLFVSADEDWMDRMAQRKLIVPGSRETFLGNALVLVTAKDNPATIATEPISALRDTLAAQPVAMADTRSVPAGKYGKAALEKLGLWEVARPHVVAAENVRAALALVERGAAPLGIVYATDARASAKVRVVWTFPETSHPPISYPVARLTTSTNPDAERFRAFLVSDKGKAIFARYGFVPR
ncbi:molybdate transport system substrate-binding protein [Hephaestia caeni]|uniref:Molybdate transport system substrate-binding protein n=1 Tax=Hephaestia caeni TaxID=645617 RepID=A0A397P8J3_9SPHN|nr:molybdate ABC transporter substrate-binding protein [Hephaestia caeni]RIA44643.1 molybdate transport system substrate-binding protein [Hephaestia caeni]